MFVLLLLAYIVRLDFRFPITKIIAKQVKYAALHHQYKIIIMKENPSNMGTEVETKPRDCLACRITSALGLIGIGGYLANTAYKNKTFAGKYTISCLSFGFIVLGVARYKQTYPFQKKEKEAA